MILSSVRRTLTRLLLVGLCISCVSCYNASRQGIYEDLGTAQAISDQQGMVEYAYDLALAWDEGAYLNWAQWTVACGEPTALPLAHVNLVFIAKRRMGWHMRTLQARVHFDFRENQVEFFGADLTTAGPPDSRTDLLNLPIDFEAAIDLVQATSQAKAYGEQHPNCVIGVWLQDNTWDLSYAQDLEALLRSENILRFVVDARSGASSIPQQ